MVYKKIEKLFPLVNNKNSFLKYLEYCEKVLKQKIKEPQQARVKGDYGKEEYQKLIGKYTNIPVKGKDSKKLIKNLIQEFFSGIPRWRSPELVHNVGSPTNVISSSIYSLALDENIYNINDGLAVLCGMIQLNFLFGGRIIS